jgi:orotate phosphoribosyltransferase
MKDIGVIRDTYGVRIARKALEMEAISLKPQEPYQWASGYRMPIYNDNRRLLADPGARELVAEAFAALIGALSIEVDDIAGTATAGIPHATTLADLLGKPLSYVRSSGKDHGLKNQIEGLDASGSYHRRRVLLIEDLISTGGSSIKAVQAIREAQGEVSYCLAIFTYGMQASVDAFAALDPACTPLALLDYDTMVATALATGYVDDEGARLLSQWRRDPFGWGAANGFPPATK